MSATSEKVTEYGVYGSFRFLVRLGRYRWGSRKVEGTILVQCIHKGMCLLVNPEKLLSVALSM